MKSSSLQRAFGLCLAVVQRVDDLAVAAAVRVHGEDDADRFRLHRIDRVRFVRVQRVTERGHAAGVLALVRRLLHALERFAGGLRL